VTKQTRCPVFIVGPPRSGTTLMRLMLNAHSEIAIPDETGIFFWLYQWAGIPRIFRGPLSKRQQLVAALGREVTVKFDDLPWTNKPRKFRDVVEWLFSTYAQQRQKTHWGEKTPAHVMYIKQIKRMFPECTIIYMSRDPRAIISSYLRYSRSKARTTSDFWMCDTIEAAVAQYVKYTDPALANESQITIVKYEDLVNEPKQTLDRVLALLDLPYESGMLKYNRSAEKRLVESISKRDGQLPEWKRGGIESPKKELIGRWEGELTQTDLLFINSNLKKYIRFFEYPT